MKNVIQLAVAIVSVFIGSLQAQPVIVTQPASTNVALGSSFTVQVVATGTNLAYQWWFTNLTTTNIFTDGTNTSYTVSGAAYTNSGNYWVVVSNSPLGVVASSQAVVNVWAKPTITNNPLSQILATNTPTSLTVGAIADVPADGNNPLWYQWFNGTNSLGAASTLTASNTYAWTGPATNYTGNYSVVVTNAVGAVTSAVAVVEFVVAPVFTNTPPNPIYLSNNASYTIRSAANGKYMSYQWYENTNILAGETNATLSLNIVSSENNGNYTNTASNVAGTVTNAGSTVIVYAPPTITVQPIGATNFGTNIANPGATISVTAVGGGNLHFAWSVGTNFLGNGTTSTTGTNDGYNTITATNTFTIPGLAVTNGTYTVTVTNEVGKVTSDGTVVQIVNLPVIITQPVSNITLTAGSTYTLSVALTNASSQLLSYQWYYTNLSNVSNLIAGATSSTLALTNVNTTSTPGTYWVIVTNPAGTVTSSNAVIGVQVAPIITGIVATNSVPGLLGTSNYFSAGVGTNTALTVAVDATSSNPMVYQWLNGTNILRTITNSSHTDSYTVGGTVSNYSGAYSVVVSNLVGKASTNVTVTFVEPPGIPANQPADAGALVGGSVTFSVACTNAATSMLTYQWYRTNASYPLVGFTNSSLTVTNIQTNSAGIYFVKVNNPANQEATSRSATLTVQTMPAISQQPTNTVVAVGASLTNYVGATGGLLSYQWRNGTNQVLGATNGLLVIPNAQTTNSGSYTVSITNAAGKVTSAPPAVVWVIASPVIVTNPSTAGAISGSDHVFVVAVDNAANSLLSYQWYFNSNVLRSTAAGGLFDPTNAVSGETRDSLYLAGVDAAYDNGYYAVVVTNIAGMATSTVAQLTVQAAPTITAQPQGATIGLLSNLTLSVTASGDGLGYQWYKDNQLVGGSNQNTFAITIAQFTNAGTYYVAVTNQVGSTNSASVVVNVVDYPVIVTQPRNAEVAQGGIATFTVVVTNVASSLLSYQWCKDTTNNPIVGEISSNLVVRGVVTNSEGAYMVTITSARGTIISSNATLTMLAAPAITLQPQSTNVVVGSNFVMTVAASGGGSPTYQWWRIDATGTNALNNNATTLAISNAPLSAAGAYYVEVSNYLGKATSSNAVVQVVIKPGISKQPVGITNQVGTEYTFTVTASPTYLTNVPPVMIYQWYTNSVAINNAITGATNSSYYIASLRTNDAASYIVVITNIAGAVTSAPAILVAQSTPLITSQPQGAIVAVSNSVTTLSVSTNGDGLGYQWYKNGQPVSGSNSYNYYIASAVTNDTATYYVVVTNLVGSDISVPVTVTVVVAPNLTQPESGTNVIGNDFTFRVGMGSSNETPTIHFQWRKGTNAIAGATDTNYYTIRGTTFDDVATNYNVLVWNIAGTNQSSNALLSVDAPPSIASQSGSTNIAYSAGFAVLQVLAATNHDLVYQWYKGTNLVANSNGVNLTVFGTALTNSDTYTVLITNLAGSITNTGAVVNVVTNAQILTPPQSLTNAEWSTATFMVALEHSTNAFASYQWFKGGTPISGETRSNLVLTSISVADEGDYVVLVSNIVNAVSSTAAHLTVETMPAISAGPVSTNLATNGAIVLDVTASGKNLKYQWMKDSTNIVQPFSSTNAFTTNTSAKAVDSGTYTVIVSNDVGSVVSAGAVVTVMELPVFSRDLTTNSYSFITYNTVTNVLAVESGGSFEISVSVTNVADSLLTYEWYFTNTYGTAKTNFLGGFPSDWYALGGLTTNDMGGYFVVVTNLAGSATSAVAQLLVQLAPYVTNIPDTNFVLGQPMSLTAGAIGDNIGTNWYKNGTFLTSGILTNATAATNDAGYYYVQVTNAVGSWSTTNFNISIIALPTVELVPPTNNYIKADGNATYTLFTTNLTGGGTMTYQWWTNFGNGFGMDSSNGPNYTVSASITGFTNSYFVVVTNVAGTNISKTTNTVIGEMPITNFVALFSGTTNIGKTSNLVFSVAVTNADALVYQWYKNGVSIVSSNGTNLTLGNLGINDSGSYSVSVSNHVSSTNSDPMVVKVVAPPSILTQPKSANVVSNYIYKFSVECINATNSLLSYQWFWRTNAVGLGSPNGSNTMTLDTNNTINYLSITNAGTNATGQYWVVVTNVAGVVTSSVVTLNVQTPPHIDRSTPTNTVIAVGTYLTNGVSATGEGLTYKWFKGATVLSSLTTSNLIIPNAQVADSGSYTVIVTNYVGSDTNTTNVLVVAAPIIISQPQSRTLTNNSVVTFRVVVTNADISALTYSWWCRTNGALTSNALAGATNTYTISHVDATNSGVYWVIVSNIAGVVVSSNATLWAESLPTVTTPVLSGVTLTNGAIATNHPFTLIVTNGGDNSGVQYWSKDGVPMLGETKTNYDVSSAAITNSGSYTVTVSNHVGTVTSSNYVVNVVGLPVIGIQPFGTTIVTNGSYTLSVGVSTPTNASFFTNQWYHSGVSIPNATNIFYRIDSATTNDAGNYYVSVIDVAGTNTSSNARMVVIASPVISKDLAAGVTNKFGTDLSAYLTVAATGGGTNGGNLQYLWYYDGGSGATLLTNSCHQDSADPDSGVGTSTVTNIPSAQTTNSGNYFVVVTNSAGSITSSIASILILTNPVITLDPKGSTNTQGSSYTFVVAVSNAANSMLSYQWYKTNYTNLLWNASTLRLINLDPTNAGGYYVIVTNLAGAATSRVATLSIQATPIVTTDLFNTNIAVSSNLTLTVGATAVGGVYRWTKDNTNVALTRSNVVVTSSDTGSVLSITNAQTNDSGIYKLYITNKVGNMSSASARVWVVAKPGIRVQPADGIGTEGGSYTFSVVASNAATSALSYQWRTNGVDAASNMDGATNSYITVSSLTTSNTGTYCVFVTNVAGSITSRVASLTVMGVPKFVSQPTSTNLPVGSNIVLSASASGSYLKFTWLKGATNILNATNSVSVTNGGITTSTLTISNAQTTNSTNYSVIVSNSLGKIITSSNAAVLVVAAPVFQTNLTANVYVGDGSNYTFSVTMTNAAKSLLTYQWACTNGTSGFTNIDGAISNSYKWLAGGGSGPYLVVVSNLAGAVTSTPCILGSLGKPSIDSGKQPLETQLFTTNLATNGTITMSVVASGGNLTYQWRKGTWIVPTNYGGNTDTLSITNAKMTNAGVYSVTISNAAGSVISSNATVNVVALPAFQIRPVGATNVSGVTNKYTFSVTMSNAATALLSYQWRTNGIPITNGTYQFISGISTIFTGAMSNVFTITGLTASNSADYTVVVTNLAGSVTSTPVAKLLVQDGPQITTNLTNINVALKDVGGLSLTVSASGSALRYQWFKNATAINHATNAILTNTSLAIANMGITKAGSNNFYVIVSNKVYSIKSSNVAVVVVAPPGIQTQPIGKDLATSNSYTLSVVASNAALSMLSYQWYTNSTSNFTASASAPAAPSTNTTYKLTNVTSANDAWYSVVVSNMAGTNASKWARITVSSMPTITTQPTNTYGTNGSSTVGLSVTASGANLTYQWFKNGTAMKGWTYANFTFGPAMVTNSGVYYVVVSNVVGRVQSSNAVVTVVTNPVFVTSLSNVVVALGSNYTFKVVMTNATNSYIGYRYQWFKPGGIVWEGAFTNTAPLVNVGYADQGTYQVIVTNVCGLANTSSATLTVQAMPVITQQPTPLTQTITNGMDFTVTVVASGDALVYQWSKKRGTTTTILKDATNSSLTISAATSTNSGAYSVVISNLVGKVTSSNAQVNIWQKNGTTWVKYTLAGGSATNASEIVSNASDSASLAGDYTGLFVAANGVPTHQTAGLLIVSVTPGGAYSGKLLLGGDVIGISGQLDASGNSVAEFERSGKSALTVTLTANAASKQLTGSVSAAGWTSALIADRSVFSIASPAPTAGEYTLVIPATQPPEGLSATGYALVSVNGAITFVGTTSEGLSISQSTTVSKDGYWPFYVSDADGEIIGWLQFINGEPFGTLNWINSSGTGATVSEVIGTGPTK